MSSVQDERNQVLIAYLWIRQTWHDAYLKWNKDEYDGLEVIRIPSSLVWRPDLVLYNKYARTFMHMLAFLWRSLYNCRIRANTMFLKNTMLSIFLCLHCSLGNEHVSIFLIIIIHAQNKGAGPG